MCASTNSLIVTPEVIEFDSNLSEEDQALKTELLNYVRILTEKEVANFPSTINLLREKILASTSSMTSVPKPLKFLKQDYGKLKEIYAKRKDLMLEDDVIESFAEILSVLSLVIADADLDCLNFRFECNRTETITIWGYEYVSRLSDNIMQNWIEISKKFKRESLILVNIIVEYFMRHNLEMEACDLVIEIEDSDIVVKFVDETCYNKVCLYLESCIRYAPHPENIMILRTLVKISRRLKHPINGIRYAILLNDAAEIRKIYETVDEHLVRKQIAFILGRQQFLLRDIPNTFDDAYEIMGLMSNAQLHDDFIMFARELDIMDPKTPDDVFKTKKFSTAALNSARQNLASTFVNGLVNAGFSCDKLMCENQNHWIYRNKEHGMMSATATLGLIFMWDYDGGLIPLDKYLYSPDDNIRAGALLGVGIVNCSIRNEFEPAIAILSEYVLHKTDQVRIGAIIGLGIAYAGTNKQMALDLITPVFSKTKNMEVMACASIAIGLIAVGTADPRLSELISQTLIGLTETSTKRKLNRLLMLGLGLLYFRCENKIEAISAVTMAMHPRIRDHVKLVIEICSKAGSHDVLKIQELITMCSEPPKPKEIHTELVAEDIVTTQQIAVIGIGLIAMGDDISCAMALRSFGNIYRYSDTTMKKVVPLAIALMSISNPQMQVIEILSKFSHDPDSDVANSAIISLGLVGAGTNNARITSLLRSLSKYHSKSSTSLFATHLALGFVFLGKGALTLNPFHSNRLLINNVVASSLLVVVFSFMDTKHS